jgi:hypothetical protein
VCCTENDGHLRFSDTLLAPFYDWVARPACTAARIVTRTDVDYEAALAQAPALQLVDDLPVPGSSWFRPIRLKTA